ncbi:MAG: hypothetical protein M1818_002252 [Claussenomyces sp. TS43310]|nr:MAG: hypothetical protein M1818_002252 [Claussenomyces sp. TS43310]
MPWLSRRSSAESAGSDLQPEQNPPTVTESVVDFIPAQIDGLCGTCPSRQKQTSRHVFLTDLLVLFQNIGYVPRMAMLSYAPKRWRSTPSLAGETALHCSLALAQVCMLSTAVLCFFLLPGLVLATWVALCWIVTAALSWPLNGPAIVRIMPGKAAPMTEDFSDECWLYINGMMTRHAMSKRSFVNEELTCCSNRSLRAQCERLCETFSRPITGIRNPTRGLVFDLLVTLLLRSCLLSRTACTQTLTSQIRDACLSNSVRKVIILSHSTGSLHLSLALDTLHAELPVDVLSKLEIYTFGSAASYLSNPLLRIETLRAVFSPSLATQTTFTRSDGSIKSPVKATLASLGHRIEDHERVIPHVEHFALQSDILARWGILHNVKNVLDNRFCGRVFVLNDREPSGAPGAKQRRRGGGFLFSEHYMDQIFPADGSPRSRFLDAVVRVDAETAEKREFTAMGIALPMKSVSNAPSYHPHHQSHPESPLRSPKSESYHNHLSGMQHDHAVKRASWGTAGAMGLDGVGKARTGARECEGKTMRQLSRLWRFEKGGRPVGEGVPVLNGAGETLSVGR